MTASISASTAQEARSLGFGGQKPQMPVWQAHSSHAPAQQTNGQFPGATQVGNSDPSVDNRLKAPTRGDGPTWIFGQARQCGKHAEMQEGAKTGRPALPQ
jgi:hypothetical protein